MTSLWTKPCYTKVIQNTQREPRRTTHEWNVGVVIKNLKTIVYLPNFLQDYTKNWKHLSKKASDVCVPRQCTRLLRLCQCKILQTKSWISAGNMLLMKKIRLKLNWNFGSISPTCWPFLLTPLDQASRTNIRNAYFSHMRRCESECTCKLYSNLILLLTEQTFQVVYLEGCLQV